MSGRLLRTLYRALVPDPIRQTVRAYRILSRDFGHYRSLRERACVAADGSPLPWYTYPAIEYLNQLDLSGLSVFEYGSGNSTLYWAARCARLVSVEDNPQWYKQLRPRLPAHVDYRLVRGAAEYAGAILLYPQPFDVIVIDGAYRLECARLAVQRLQPGGFIVFDNSDWYERSTAVLQESALLHVSLAGFGPQLPYTWTTSFYFSRDARPKPRGARHPDYGIGALHHTEAQGRGETGSA
jgi:hypothetical protein